MAVKSRRTGTYTTSLSLSRAEQSGSERENDSKQDWPQTANSSMVLICTWSAHKFLLVSRKADTCTTALMPGITGLSIVTEYHYKGQPMKSFTSLISLHIPPQCCSKCWYQPPVPAFVSAGWSDGQLAAVPCAAAALVQLMATVSHDQPHPTWTVFPFGIGKAKIRRFQEKSLLSRHKKK